MDPLPTSLYESLLLKLIAILELTQHPEGIVTPRAKQLLLQATNDFKNAIVQAKDLAINLPGGELLISEQDDVIQMLEMLRSRKRAQLFEFAARNVVSATEPSKDTKMEVDSIASTPVYD